ncbi:MAG: chromosome segregation protein SMC [Eubacterium sp.]|nr:chromosome segregation protein SMC [Eubacterium sp.]
MYLKRIELAGFKSFAGKSVFEFHNGITGIVGPNGSGKSNVADAVRWVLGEQKVKQLRSASMQDVIFAGTEARKPLSYAYVAITLDNSDHSLDTDYTEVTVARRIYRSGESEYLINGTSCRLKDVQELFYDTGIGKEGYSIIGQGQIDKILSGKPEDRRELFDEAAGIVKYKRRKAAAQKKLESHRDNLLRVGDIINELERELTPLKEQSETAKIYLSKKEELKNLDIHYYIRRVDELKAQMESITEKEKNLEAEAEDTEKQLEALKKDFEKSEKDREEVEALIEKTREDKNRAAQQKTALIHEIDLLNEQIKNADASAERFVQRMDKLSAEKEERTAQKTRANEEFEKNEKTLYETVNTLNGIRQELDEIKKQSSETTEKIEAGKRQILEITEQRTHIEADRERLKTIGEQTESEKQKLVYRKEQVNEDSKELKELIELKRREEEEAKAVLSKHLKGRDNLFRTLNELGDRRNLLNDRAATLNDEKIKAASRLESLNNMAERYEGYSQSVKQVMSRKKANSGILGVVADIIEVDKKYETAIETALGGNIRNIVTDDEDTARDMIEYLKKNKYGRATFLPLTSVRKRNDEKEREVLGEKGVIDLAPRLVKAQKKYDNVISFLLGQIIVVDTVDNALALARRHDYSLRMVTLSGELLSPGGSITGGAFKGSGNLLGRRREIEELEEKIRKLTDDKKEVDDELREIHDRRAEIRGRRDDIQDDIKAAEIALNEVKSEIARMERDIEDKEEELGLIDREFIKIEEYMVTLEKEGSDVNAASEDADVRCEEIARENALLIDSLSEVSEKTNRLEEDMRRILQEEAALREKRDFSRQDLERVEKEIEKLAEEEAELTRTRDEAKGSSEEKKEQIETIKKTIEDFEKADADFDKAIEEAVAKKEAMSGSHNAYMEKREDLIRKGGELEKEGERLNHQMEAAREKTDRQHAYMWEEYELTYHNARELIGEDEKTPENLEASTRRLRDDIKALGVVNVNAIEEYREVSERHAFLTTQRDDIEKAKENLITVINDLDTGMRKQFDREFDRIRKEFQRVFTVLFGGGKGNLELVEGEDLLEAGIEINAQPPGKKLQNMMQLSGGEKALVAISLLFAIQNLKPSPFCLLDEIEAALDEPNVDRFAKYLRKLSVNTQFIVITHRRGTMNSADRLYGITMQEKGVSVQVSVNLVEDSLDEESA